MAISFLTIVIYGFVLLIFLKLLLELGKSFNKELRKYKEAKKKDEQK